MPRPSACRCGLLRSTMRRSTTSVATDRRRGVAAHARSRRRLSALLVTELICALVLVGRPPAESARPVVAAPATLTMPTSGSTVETLADRRTVHLVGMGGAQTAPLLARIGAEMNEAARAVTAFW